MEFNKLYQSLLEKLDPEVEAVWGDIVPGITEPVTYHCYTVVMSRGMYDVWKHWSVKARSIEEAQDKVYDVAWQDWKDSWAENAESARDDYDEDVDPDDPPENEFIEKFPIERDDKAIVGSGEETIVVISTNRLTNKQIETFLDNTF